MTHQLSTRGKFAVATLLFILLATILTMLVPFTVFETTFNRSNYLMITMPFTNVQYFAYAMVLIIICLIVLTFIRKWYTYLFSACVTAGAIALIVCSATNYIAVEEHGIHYKYLTTEQHFDWATIEEIVFAYETGAQADYIITLADSSTFTFPHTGNIGIHGKRAIYSVAMKNDTPFIEREKK